MTPSIISEPAWKSKAEAKREAVKARIPTEWLIHANNLKELREDVMAAPAKLLTAKELEITQTASALELLRKLATGELSAVDVASAFMHRAAVATQLTNCGTEIFFDIGLERAKYLDEYYAKHGKLIGPFHGLPISVKDSFNINDIDTTLGITEFIGNANKFPQASMVNLLLDLGAVLYIKTNIPQTMMTADSENNIFGRTLNPNDVSLTAGGSSGGEGALVRQRGSIIGVGTDIAGSIRIPSACCYTYGLKPSSNRLPYNTRGYEDGPFSLGIETSSGPLANTFEDLKFFFDTVVEKKPWAYDVNCSPSPLIKTEPIEKLRVGVIYECPLLPVHPPVKAALRVAAHELEKAGHEIVTIKDFPSYDDGWKVALSIFTIQIEGDEDLIEVLLRAEEPLIKSLSQGGIDHYVPKVADNLKEVVKLLRERKGFCQKWLEIFTKNNIDVLITPPSPSTAPPHDTYGIAPYTSMWNLVDYPALVIPYGKVETSYEATAEYEPHLEGIYSKYDPEVFSKGLTSIQIVTPRALEEKLLAAGEVIDKVLNKV
ncbi:CIC11C00000000554 [Sungouiella intermedia]|uniref:CIC11C00000000554 n=1 Tax=Sungouiella intermedia TaxID=45354 RepID=A0A1L0BW66_9ASCO|nr:CIC11C00000000554 [[Candida] intermedia]